MVFRCFELCRAVYSSIRSDLIWLEMMAMVFDVWMMCVSFLFNHCIEAVMFVGHIVNDTFGAIGLVEPVLTFHLVTMSSFPGLFVIMRMLVFNTVAVFIIDWSLYRTQNTHTHTNQYVVNNIGGIIINGQI